ncbi:MAG: hypothetical protein RJA70_1620 [Pseudomonadota bacterium]|jgi:acyl carrier protein
MQRDEILHQLEGIIKPYLPGDSADPILLSEDADLVLQLGVSSMHMIDIILEIEEDFNIEFSSSDTYNMSRVGDVVDLIQQKTKSTTQAEGN